MLAPYVGLLLPCEYNRQKLRPHAVTRFPPPTVSPQHYFLIVFGHDGQKPLELRTEEESECDEWVEAIQQARYAPGTWFCQ